MTRKSSPMYFEQQYSLVNWHPPTSNDLTTIAYNHQRGFDEQLSDFDNNGVGSGYPHDGAKYNGIYSQNVMRYHTIDEDRDELGLDSIAAYDDFPENHDDLYLY